MYTFSLIILLKVAHIFGAAYPKQANALRLARKRASEIMIEVNVTMAQANKSGSDGEIFEISGCPKSSSHFNGLQAQQCGKVRLSLCRQTFAIPAKVKVREHGADEYLFELEVQYLTPLKMQSKLVDECAALLVSLILDLPNVGDANLDADKAFVRPLATAIHNLAERHWPGLGRHYLVKMVSNLHHSKDPSKAVHALQWFDKIGEFRSSYSS